MRLTCSTSRCTGATVARLSSSPLPGRAAPVSKVRKSPSPSPSLVAGLRGLYPCPPRVGYSVVVAGGSTPGFCHVWENQLKIYSPVPNSDAYQHRFLVPKGMTIACDGIRTSPRARSYILHAGTYPVLWVADNTEPTVNGGKTTYHYIVDSHGQYITLSVDLLPVYSKLSHRGFDLFDDQPCSDDGKPWGWYGLDWYFDEDGDFTRLRRMVKVPNAATLANF